MSKSSRSLYILALILATAMAMMQPANAQAKGQAIVIGAGVAGLKAGLDLQTKGYGVTILEARNRLGGRVYTVQSTSGNGPVEIGAQWIHGSSSPVLALAKTQGWNYADSALDDGINYQATSATSATPISDAEESAWAKQFDRLASYVDNLQWDMPAADSLQKYIDKFKSSKGISGRNAVGLDLMIDQEWVQEYAASPSKLSFNWFDDGDDLDGGETVLTGGYSQVVDYLYTEFSKRGGKVVLNAPVTLVAYSSTTRVTVTTQNGQTYNGRFAVVTLPVGVLNSKKVVFRPSLPSTKTSALSKLGMGTLNKVVLEFPASASWDAITWIDRIPLASDAGRWREFFNLRKVTGKPIIVAFTAGDPALYPSSTSDATLVNQAVAALRGMYGAANIPDPVGSYVTRWHTDPWSLGSYSVYAPGAKGTERTTLSQPTSKLLYWAGEAASKDFSATVQGAWMTGANAATAAARDNP